MTRLSSERVDKGAQAVFQETQQIPLHSRTLLYERNQHSLIDGVVLENAQLEKPLVRRCVICRYRYRVRFVYDSTSTFQVFKRVSLTTKVPFPAIPNAMPLPIVAFTYDKLLPPTVSSRSNHNYRIIISPSNYALSGFTTWDSWYRYITSHFQTSLWVVIDLKMRGREGVGVRKNSRKERNVR